MRRDGESPCLARVPVLWACGREITAGCFPLSPGWASGCVKPLDPTCWGVDKGQPPISGARGNTLSPGVTGERAEGERFPRRQESLVWDLDWSTGRPSDRRLETAH